MEPETKKAKELMERWNMNDVDFVAYVDSNLPRIVYGSGPEFCHYPRANTGFQRYLIPRDRKSKTKARIFDFEIGQTAVLERLDDLFFYTDNVEEFEKAHPDLLRAKYVPLEGEKPILGYARIAKHMGKTVQTVKKNYKPQGAPIANIDGHMTAYPSCLDKWMADTGKRRKK